MTSKAVRSVRLRVIGGTVEIRDDVPGARSECRDAPRPCPHVKCKYHLWLVEGHDRVGAPPKNRPPESTLRPVWMEWPLPPSCALDKAEQLAPGTETSDNHSTTEIGRWLGVHRIRVNQIVREALAKLGIASGELGVVASKRRSR